MRITLVGDLVKMLKSVDSLKDGIKQFLFQVCEVQTKQFLRGGWGEEIGWKDFIIAIFRC